MVCFNNNISNYNSNGINNKNINNNNNNNNINNCNKNNSLLPPEVLHQIYKSLEPKQRFCQIPLVCSDWNKACQSQPFPIDTDVTIHISLFEQYFSQNSINTSQIQLYDYLKTTSVFPCINKYKSTEKEVETLYGKYKTDIKYQPLIYKKVRSNNKDNIIFIDNTKFDVKELFKEKLKKKWKSLSHEKDIPNRNLIPVFKKVQFYIESPAMWFDPVTCDIFIQIIHDIFYTISPYAPENIDIGLISLPVLHQIPVNVKHLTLAFLMRDYGEAIEYICNHFTQLESLDLTIESDSILTPELNGIINDNSSLTNYNKLWKSLDDKSFIKKIKNNNLIAQQYAMLYTSTKLDDIIIRSEKFKGLVKLKNLQKFLIHNPIHQISNVKLMYNILSRTKSLKELSFCPRILLTRVDDQHLISMIHSLVKLHQLDFENPYLELWNSIKICNNITELSLNYTHRYLSSIIRDVLFSNIEHNDNSNSSSNDTQSNTTMSSTSMQRNRLNNSLYLMNRNNNLINPQNNDFHQIVDAFFMKSIQGITNCFPNLEKLRISWQATHFPSNRDYTISIQNIVDNLVHLKKNTKLKSITMLYKDPTLASKLEKALGKAVEIKIYQ